MNAQMHAHLRAHTFTQALKLNAVPGTARTVDKHKMLNSTNTGVGLLDIGLIQ